MGADIDALEIAQGKVTLNEPSAITANSADINFVAPDAQGCPVDYSSKDGNLIEDFKRVPDTGKERTRAVRLSGFDQRNYVSLPGQLHGGATHGRVPDEVNWR